MSARLGWGACFVLMTLVAGCGDFGAPVPSPAPSSIAPSVGPSVGGQLVAIQGRGFSAGSAVLFDGAPATDVTVVSSALITARTPAHAAGDAAVLVLDAVGRSAPLELPYTFVDSLSAEGRPRVVSAISTSNTSVRVVFSEPVRDAADPENFSVTRLDTSAEAARLPIVSARASEDGVWVELETRSQSDVLYRLTAANIRDLDGNLLAPPEVLVDPTTTTFAGTPPGMSELRDGDGDGLYDHVELAGWTVTVFLTNGDVVQRTVTSDPENPDTDGDGLGDGDERVAGTNPRSSDTDGDTVGDDDEWNAWWSDPCDQDSDDDGLADGIELWLGTSPILADTDGDGVDDEAEQFELSRNPLLADLPRPRIVVGGYDLQVEIQNSYTDETGTTHSNETSASTSVSQSEASSLSRSDTRSTQAENRFSQSLGVEFGFGGGPTVWSGKVTASVGFEQSRAEGYSSTVGSESSRQATQSWDRSVSEGFEQSESRSVTRTISSARMLATVNIANEGSVPFTMENLEISVLRQDRGRDGTFRPVGTLRPREPISINLGPLDPERGPIVFENSEIFPNLVDDLLRDPTGLVFQVANFDVTDEDGRNFAYTSATVNSRTAGLTIDYGDGRVASYRVATHNSFDERGQPRGISIARALEIIGLSVTHDDDTPLPLTPPRGGWPEAVRGTLGTLTSDDGVERLVRVREVQNSLDGAEKRFWTVLTDNTTLSADTNFSDIQLRAGQSYLLLYASDLDEDGLFDREELLYGSSDRLADTDGDGLSDLEEVRDGVPVRVTTRPPYLAFSSPARADSDADGVSDTAERLAGTDPTRGDTDGDGVSDGVELQEEDLEITLSDFDLDPTNDPLLTLRPYSDNVLLDGGNRAFDGVVSGDDVLVASPTDGIWLEAGPNGVIDSTPAGDDRVVLLAAIAPGPDGLCSTLSVAPGSDDVIVRTGAAAPDQRCVHAGLDGRLETLPTGDDFARALHDGRFVLDPRSADTDLDGISDGRELATGGNPNARDAGSLIDSDQDGLFDSEETNGWDVVVDGVTRHVTSNPLSPDTDRDGVPDTYENILRTDPRSSDTDGDGLRDGREIALTDPWWTFTQIVAADTRCRGALHCSFTESSSATHSDPRSTDSDGDTLSDPDEITGWSVTVFGATSARAVSSSPALADTDGDGLRDDGERSRGLDPRSTDTDADGTSDSRELTPPSGFTTPRDPLRPDRWIALTASVVVGGDCESGSSDGGQFYGTMSSSPTGRVSYDFAACRDVPEGRACRAVSTTRSILSQGESFTIITSGVYEDDTTGDDHLPDTATGPFNYAGVSDWTTEPVRIEIRKDDGCRLTATVVFEVQ